MALTAGIGSDHIDLPSAAKANVTVAEITGTDTAQLSLKIMRCSCPLCQLSIYESTYSCFTFGLCKFRAKSFPVTGMYDGNYSLDSHLSLTGAGLEKYTLMAGIALSIFYVGRHFMFFSM